MEIDEESQTLGDGILAMLVTESLPPRLPASRSACSSTRGVRPGPHHDVPPDSRLNLENLLSGGASVPASNFGSTSASMVAALTWSLSQPLPYWLWGCRLWPAAAREWMCDHDDVVPWLGLETLPGCLQVCIGRTPKHSRVPEEGR